MTRRLTLVLAISMLALVGCSGKSGCSGSCGSTSTTAPAPTTVPPLDVNPAYAKRGPNVVAITTLAVGTRRIEVFYPGRAGSERNQPRANYDIREALHNPAAAPLKASSDQLVALPAFRDLPPAAGRFPVVLFSHAYGSFPLANATLESDIAAWGFVVIAPDHLERDTYAVEKVAASVDDARDARVLLSVLPVVAADPALGSKLDLTHVAAVGSDQGGATALAALASPKVATAVAWASVAPKQAVAKKPVALIGAQRDFGYGTKVQQAIYAGLTGPRSLLLLGGGAGHATFEDNCAMLRDSSTLPAGGDIATGLNAGNRMLALAQNGCYPNEVDPRLVWAVVSHVTVAHLRSVFGIDPAPVGLGDNIASAFPKVPFTYERQP